MFDKKLFIRPNRNDNSSIRIFLFPFAGGSAHYYKPWLKYFDKTVEVIFVQLPGRAERIDEKPYDTMSSVIAQLMEYSAFITEKPYLILGHSLGAKIAYELSCTLERQTNIPPLHLIVSGSKAPHLVNDKPNIYSLPKSKFIDELRVLDGTPEEILDNEELMELFIPLLRADFKIAELYVSKEHKLSIPITVLSGMEDTEVSVKEANAWVQLSSTGCEVKFFTGSHFFINDHIASIVKIINNIVKQ